VAATLVVGYIVNLLGTENRAGLAGLLVVGGVFGLAAALTLTKATMPVNEREIGLTARDIRGVMHNRAFVRLVIGTLLLMLPFYLAVAYYHVFNLEVVKMSPWLIACMGVGYLLVKLLITPAMGKLCDRLGPRKLLWVSGPIYAAFFLCFPFAAEGRAWPIILAWAFVALADGIYSVAAPAALYSTIPEQGARPAYFATYNLVSLGSFAVGGVIAVPLLGWLGKLHWTWGVANLGGYHLFFALCGLLMLPCTLAVTLFPENRRLPVGSV
jgi:MFS family permease